MMAAIRPVVRRVEQYLPVPALCLMLPDGAARFGRRTPEPHVWPAAPSALARGDGWRGAAGMTDESVKVRLERGDWVSLDEAFPELIPSDLKEKIKAVIADAAPYGSVSVIDREMQRDRMAERARQNGSNGPPSVRMAFKADRRNAIAAHFREVWSAIDEAVRQRLAGEEWEVERIMPDGVVRLIAPLAWRNMRFHWDGEQKFSGRFSGAKVCFPDASGKWVSSKPPLGMFQIRRVTADQSASLPESNETKRQRVAVPTVQEASEAGVPATPVFWPSFDELIELALTEDQRRHNADEELLTHDTRFAFMQLKRPTLTRNQYDTIIEVPLREKAKERGITLRGRGAPPKKNK